VIRRPGNCAPLCPLVTLPAVRAPLCTSLVSSQTFGAFDEIPDVCSSCFEVTPVLLGKIKSQFAVS